MDNLALLYRQSQQLKKAEALFIEVIYTRKRVQGPAHPDTLNSMTKLALTYRDQGDLKNAENQETMVYILNQGGDHAQITEEKAVQIAKSLDREMMRLLLERRGDKVQITEKVVKAAAGNESSGEEVMTLLLERRGDEVQITEEVVKAAAGNESSGEEVMTLLLERRANEVQITEEVVKAAAGSGRSGKGVMTLLLKGREDEVQITEEAVIQIVRKFDKEVTMLLLERRGDKGQITEEAVVQIARRFDKEVMMLLLERRGDEVQITEEVVKAAAGNELSGEEVMTLLLERRDFMDLDSVMSDDATEGSSAFSGFGGLSSNSTLATSYQGPRTTLTAANSRRHPIPELPDIVDQDVTSVASADSELFSTNDMISSNSTLSRIREVAIKYLVQEFTTDVELTALYKLAIAKMPLDRFVRNHERLLRMYFIQLGSHEKTSKERLAIRVLRGRTERNMMAQETCRLLALPDPLPSETTTLQEIDRLLVSPVPFDVEKRRADKVDVAAPVASSSEQDDKGDDSENFGNDVDENLTSSLSNLHDLVQFLMGGEPFRTYKEGLREFVKPDIFPETLEASLSGGRVEEVKRLLDEHFGSVARGEFIWLLELRDHGYKTEEIAQLLMNEKNDSPWIYFEPRDLPREAIIPSHHQPFCVHTGGQDVRLGSDSILSTTSGDKKDHRASWASDDESLTHLEELCGLAGIAPNTRDLSKWVGSVKFVEEHDILTALVSFRSTLSNGSPEEVSGPPGHNNATSESLLQLSCNSLEALKNLCNAIGNAQKRGICCDSFTTLRLNNIISGQEVIELCQVRVTTVLELRSKLETFLESYQVRSKPFESLAREAIDCAEGILQEALYPSRTAFFSNSLEKMLHCCSLAVQLLSLTFSSYIKAHIGAIQPFFLDTPVQVVKLFGNQDWETGSHHITVSLYRLTCLDEMIQSPVLVFVEGRDRLQTRKPHDLLASPEDLVDTWGPGQFVTCSSNAAMQDLTAIMIGGGVIKPTAENTGVLHWSNDVEPRHNFPVRLSSKEKVLIGGGVEVNHSCRASKTERWSSFIGSLENLGTTPDYWQFTEFQAGLAVTGQQFAGGQFQFNKIWTWHPGNSWKRQHLSLLADELPLAELDRPWGLQVSSCTGVARRVPLRLLLADVMPVFAKNLALPPGWTTLQQGGIITALEQGGDNLKQWYDNLGTPACSQELQTLTRRLIRHILLVLRDTGIDREHKTLLIACPQDHTPGKPISMCLPVRCENASLWAKILTDSEHCATFACITTLCLESQEHKCQKTNPWHCPSLDTAVQQLRSRNAPIIAPQHAWNLDINSTYWIGRPESGLQAKVIRSAGSSPPRLNVSKSGVPEKTRARLGTMSRLFGPKMEHLRDRQIDTWPAEDVLILSQAR
ncbi:hypothetical protein K469DRAFT_175914 [Zopfia rhizophila CBS 207.26]|uniref:Uncharacterized protein n=1 Tax=Zopfia rhizophila CBS 207.26 TaxID=1314779 RepID=A0A6A6DY70_9PEZI|nr:hypothetical protein K469DRAFT_175914 [Zopfia rhizophila CBS 207.26]